MPPTKGKSISSKSVPSSTTSSKNRSSTTSIGSKKTEKIPIKRKTTGSTLSEKTTSDPSPNVPNKTRPNPLPRTRSTSSIRESKEKLSRKSSNGLSKEKAPLRSSKSSLKSKSFNSLPSSPSKKDSSFSNEFSSPISPTSTISNGGDFHKKQEIEYKQSDGTWISATIQDISYDEELEPYYTISIEEGDLKKEKSTIATRLRIPGQEVIEKDEEEVEEEDIIIEQEINASPATSNSGKTSPSNIYKMADESIGRTSIHMKEVGEETDEEKEDDKHEEDSKTNWGNEEIQLKKVFADASNISSNIRVAVRCRPPNKRELAGGEGGGVVVQINGNDALSGIVEVKEHAPFKFDVAFPMETTQLEVFDSLGVDIVNSAFHGYNASLFAYGQTSSGKSFSMMGVTDSNLIGLIPRISRLLFKATDNSEKSFLIETSYLEIYNEKLRDLLSDDASKSHNNDLKIRENLQLGVHVEGLNREIVTSSDEILAVIEHGFKQRTTAATLYNSESSRSHAVFEINIQGKYKDLLTNEDMVSSSRIALIDLAGSERSDKLGSKGKAMKEGNNINKSLTVLGRCIRALVDVSKGKRTAVPFRESVLTWYLRDSLSGNARTTMLAACSPVESNIEETLSTLRYASSAKNIKTSAKKNEDPAQAKIRELASELEALKHRLEEVEGQSSSSNSNSLSNRANSELTRHDNLNDMSKEEKERLFKELNNQLGHLNNNDTQDVFNKGLISQRRKSNVFGMNMKSLLLKAKHINDYPRLSCLNKDSLLSHAMNIPLGHATPFTIGRTLSLNANPLNENETSEKKNDFELNGMGMKGRHCRFDLAPNAISAQQGGLVVHSMSKGATVFVNGVEIPENQGLNINKNNENGEEEDNKYEPVILKHLDRVILGPGRLLSLYLTKPLESYEKECWDYDACFKEMIQRGKVLGDNDMEDDSLISSTRKTIVEEMNKVQLEQITQANTIAAEMAVPVRFTTDMVVRGKHGVDDPNLSVDDYFDCNDLRLLVRCFADKSQHNITTAQDLAKANVKLDEKMSKRRLSIAKDLKEFNIGRGGGGGKPSSFLDKKNKHLSASEFAKKSPKKSSFQLWETYQPSSVEKGDEEDDDDNEDEGGDNIKASSPRLLQAVKEDEEVKSDDENDTDSDSEDGDEIDKFESSLFELNLIEFEELLEDLKMAHSSVAKITGGLMDASVPGVNNNNSEEVAKDMIHNVFTSLDANHSGFIDRDELEKGLMIFNTQQDHETFLSVIWAEENLPEHISMGYEEFEKFLIRFMQRQFYHCIESYVSNRSLFVQLGGRDIQLLAKNVVKNQAVQRSLYQNNRASKISGGNVLDNTSLTSSNNNNTNAPLTALLREIGLEDRSVEFSQAGFGSLPDNVTNSNSTTSNGDDSRDRGNGENNGNNRLSKIQPINHPKIINQNILLNELLQAIKMKEVNIESQVKDELEEKLNLKNEEIANMLLKVTELEISIEMKGMTFDQIKKEEIKIKQLMVDKAKEEKDARTILDNNLSQLTKYQDEIEKSNENIYSMKKELKSEESLSFVMKTSMKALNRKLALMQAELLISKNNESLDGNNSNDNSSNGNDGAGLRRRSSVIDLIKSEKEAWETRLLEKQKELELLNEKNNNENSSSSDNINNSNNSNSELDVMEKFENIENKKKQLKEELLITNKSLKKYNNERSQIMIEYEEEMSNVNMDRMSVAEYSESQDDERAQYVIGLSDQIKELSNKCENLNKEKLKNEIEFEKLETESNRISSKVEFLRLTREDKLLDSTLVNLKLELNKSLNHHSEIELDLNKHQILTSESETLVKDLSEQVKHLERKCAALRSAVLKASTEQTSGEEMTSSSSSESERVRELEEKVKELEKQLSMKSVTVKKSNKGGEEDDDEDNEFIDSDDGEDGDEPTHPLDFTSQELEEAMDMVIELQERIDQLEQEKEERELLNPNPETDNEAMEMVIELEERIEQLEQEKEERELLNPNPETDNEAMEMVIELQERIEQLEQEKEERELLNPNPETDNDDSQSKNQSNDDISKVELENALLREEKLKEELLQAQFMSNVNSTTNEDKLTVLNDKFHVINEKLIETEKKYNLQLKKLETKNDEINSLTLKNDLKLKETETLYKEKILNLELKSKELSSKLNNNSETNSTSLVENEKLKNEIKEMELKLKEKERLHKEAELQFMRKSTTDEDLFNRVVAAESMKDEINKKLLILQKESEDMKIERNAAVKQAKIEAGAAAAARRMAAMARVERDKSLSNMKDEANKIANHKVKLAEADASRARIERDEAKAEAHAMMGAAVLAAKMKSEKADADRKNNSDNNNSGGGELNHHHGKTLAQRRETDKISASRRSSKDKKKSGVSDKNETSSQKNFIRPSVLMYPLSMAYETVNDSIQGPTTSDIDHGDSSHEDNSRSRGSVDSKTNLKKSKPKSPRVRTNKEDQHFHQERKKDQNEHQNNSNDDNNASGDEATGNEWESSFSTFVGGFSGGITGGITGGFLGGGTTQNTDNKLKMKMKISNDVDNKGGYSSEDTDEEPFIDEDGTTL